MAYSKKDKDAFLTVLERNGGNIHDACKSVGVSRRTIYKWKDSEDWFKERVEDIREISIDNVESALYKSAIEGNTTAQIFYLKTQGKSRGYIEQSNYDITSEGEKLNRIEVEIIKNTGNQNL